MNTRTTPEALPETPDLVAQLQGEGGEATRQRLTARLDALESRLQALKRAGMAHEEYPRLEATLAAIESARTALRAVRVGAPGR